jgi:hypothetical protein
MTTPRRTPKGLRLRIDKAYYRSGPALRLWWPLSRERRTWRAAFIHRDEYQRAMLVSFMVGLFDIKPGETRNGVTCLASVGGNDERN